MSMQSPPSGVPKALPTNSNALISLIAGILGLTMLPLIGSIVAVIVGGIARREIRDSAGAYGGGGMAKWGGILGWGGGGADCGPSALKVQAASDAEGVKPGPRTGLLLPRPAVAARSGPHWLASRPLWESGALSIFPCRRP